MVVYVVAALPIVCFALAAVFEQQRDRGSLRKLSRAVPLGIAGAGSVLLLIPLHSYVSSSFSSSILSRAMAVTSIIVAVCGMVCGFRSKVAAAFIVLGGILLAFFWLFNRIVV